MYSAQFSATRQLNFQEFKQLALDDYYLACLSREMSLLGRKEVLTGKAKFGIFGDGKEVAQIALAKSFKKGDWRSGYYRDQTWMMALGMLSPEQFFAQLYAHPDPAFEPFSSGRQMNAHFATRLVGEDGKWLNQTTTYNSSADASPTALQMLRALGIAHASKLYRNNLLNNSSSSLFSVNGNEISFVSIGDASTSEGHFWETVNAAAVLQVPLAVCVWDDGYGISVEKKYQTVKENISQALAGFAANEQENGIDIYVCEGWNYPKLVQTFMEGTEQIRRLHRPALFHITELTQPQGHSTSGSHERYKSKERLEWEREFDCLAQMQKWLLENGISEHSELEEIENKAKREAKSAQQTAWNNYISPIKKEIDDFILLFEDVGKETGLTNLTKQISDELKRLPDPLRRDILRSSKKILRAAAGTSVPSLKKLSEYTSAFQKKYQQIYSSNLYSQNSFAALNVKEVPAVYSANSKTINGYEILNVFFEKIFEKYPNVIAFGEDVGKIGDVNQGFAGLQQKFGEHRIFDTGIRELTIIGQAIGLSMRGFRPIAEIQYLDYLLYALEPLSDDVATLRYRTNGIQRAPLIVRTRGHRLEGIWHTGSPMGTIINSLRGMYVCVPRNMVQAAGMYNTLLQGDDPALVIECLNGYRLKEKLPDNVDEFTVPLGVPEILREGDDVTLVTYGSCVRIALEAIEYLQSMGISVELIDIQTLVPFDLKNIILNSVKKTNRIVFLDEDVPGGASAYMYQQVIEKQNAFRWLDSEPRTITAREHRAAYGSDGDYFSKPNAEDVFEVIYNLMHESDPSAFPRL
ncbi:MAG: thiamine pyrophosphate-dependent enzyme [Chitinophagales bacterium]|nr:thiamine pyrophosphate-dependent enzyme [Chitinophagales bacterium]